MVLFQINSLLIEFTAPSCSLISSFASVQFAQLPSHWVSREKSIHNLSPHPLGDIAINLRIEAIIQRYNHSIYSISDISPLVGRAIINFGRYPLSLGGKRSR